MMENSMGRECAICGSSIGDNNPDGIGGQCRSVWSRALTHTYFKFNGLGYWKKQVGFYLPLFIERFKDTKFRSEFRKSFYPSIVNQYKNVGRISKKQLEIIKQMIPGDCVDEMDKFEAKNKREVSNLIYNYRPNGEEREYCINLTKKYYAEAKGEWI